MSRGKSVGPALLLALGVSLAACAAKQPQAAPTPGPENSSDEAAVVPIEPVLEPKAIDILKAASQRLADARSMTFTAIVSYESPSILGPPLVYTTKSAVTMERPDKLRVITLGDGPASEFYYNGKEMVAFEPAANLAAVADAPPTIDAALKAAFDSAAIYFPFTDVIVADPYEGISEGMIHAFYIGQSKIVGGTTTDMVTVLNDFVFQQIWIGADDKLPRMIRAVFLDDPARLHHQLELTDWHLNSKAASNAFASPRAKAATRIPFEPPDPKLPPDAKAPAKSQPSADK